MTETTRKTGSLVWHENQNKISEKSFCEKVSALILKDRLSIWLPDKDRFIYTTSDALGNAIFAIIIIDSKSLCDTLVTMQRMWPDIEKYQGRSLLIDAVSYLLADKDSIIKKKAHLIEIFGTSSAAEKKQLQNRLRDLETKTVIATKQVAFDIAAIDARDRAQVLLYQPTNFKETLELFGKYADINISEIAQPLTLSEQEEVAKMAAKGVVK